MPGRRDWRLVFPDGEIKEIDNDPEALEGMGAIMPGDLCRLMRGEVGHMTFICGDPEGTHPDKGRMVDPAEKIENGIPPFVDPSTIGLTRGVG